MNDCYKMQVYHFILIWFQLPFTPQSEAFVTLNKKAFENIMWKGETFSPVFTVFYTV